jgi:riboflavin kinase/FMN adenylyltransferase
VAQTEGKCGAVVGVFDGVHRGHAYLFAQLREACRERRLRPVAITFAEHPLRLIAPTKVPQLLASRRETFAAIEACGVEPLVLTFDEELRRLTAREFMAMIRRRYGVELLMLGFNNRIGCDAGLSAADYRRLGEEEGVEVMVAAPYPDAEVSSSLLRQLIREGQVDRAAALLGRAPAVEGRVVSGRRLGRTIGFPTANVEPDPAVVIPGSGVYAARALNRMAVVNIGMRPTVEGHHLTIEAHIDDFSGDLYGSHLRLEFLRKLRDEQCFSSVEQLRQAIANDLSEARKR